MRILFLSYAYPNAGQPQLATFNRNMLADLARLHQVRVLAPVSFLQKFRKSSAPIGYAAVPEIPAEYPTFYYTPKMFRQRYDEQLWWSIRDHVRSTIAEFRPDVILSYWAHPDGTVAVRAAREAGIPAVVMVGGSDVLVLGRSGGRREKILQTLTAADGVIAVSGHLAETMQNDGIPAERIAVVPRGIDRQVFTPGDRNSARSALGLPVDREVIVGVGRLVDVKDWPTWIETCLELHRRGRSISAHILGNGPLMPALKRYVRDAGLEKIVSLPGGQSQAELVQWYRAADLTLLSSQSEGIPNVLLETIACGGSFVATNVGGISEIADMVYDRVVSVGSPIALALAAIDRLEHVPPRGLPRRFEPESNSDVSRRLTQVFERVCNPGTPLASSTGSTTRLRRPAEVLTGSERLDS